MTDVLCAIMGILDIIAGALILIGFGSYVIGIVFGILMIGKGVFSFLWKIFMLSPWVKEDLQED